MPGELSLSLTKNETYEVDEKRMSALRKAIRFNSLAQSGLKLRKGGMIRGGEHEIYLPTLKAY